MLPLMHDAQVRHSTHRSGHTSEMERENITKTLYVLNCVLVCELECLDVLLTL